MGLVAHKIAKISESHKSSYILKWSIIASVAALAFNCVFEPVLKYFWYTLLTPDAEKATAAIGAQVAKLEFLIRPLWHKNTLLNIRTKLSSVYHRRANYWTI